MHVRVVVSVFVVVVVGRVLNVAGAVSYMIHDVCMSLTGLSAGDDRSWDITWDVIIKLSHSVCIDVKPIETT